MIDSHCHLDLPVFAPDRAAVVDRAQEAGVLAIVVPGVRPASWPALQAMAREHRHAGAPRIAIAIGVHPQVVPHLSPEERALACDPEALAAAALAAGACAVGECGLDAATEARPEQEAVFLAHVRAARLCGLPLIVHAMRTHDAVPRILAEGQARPGRAALADGVTGVMHSYSGGVDLLPVYLRLGLSISFAGPVTYPGARRPVEAARAVPPDRLLAETDAPDQTPAPRPRGRCEPAFVSDVVRGLAAARRAETDAIAALTTANARRLFRLEPT